MRRAFPEDARSSCDPLTFKTAPPPCRGSKRARHGVPGEGKKRHGRKRLMPPPVPTQRSPHDLPCAMSVPERNCHRETETARLVSSQSRDRPRGAESKLGRGQLSLSRSSRRSILKNKDVASWSIPKGEDDAGQDPLRVAKREFEEETGFLPRAPDLADQAVGREVGLD